MLFWIYRVGSLAFQRLADSWVGSLAQVDQRSDGCEDPSFSVWYPLWSKINANSKVHSFPEGDLRPTVDVHEGHHGEVPPLFSVQGCPLPFRHPLNYRGSQFFMDTSINWSAC